MENTERKQEEMIIREGGLELCIDHDHITIPVTRFEELIKTKVTLDLIEQLYKKAPSYNLQDYMSWVFGPIEKSDDHA